VKPPFSSSSHASPLGLQPALLSALHANFFPGGTQPGGKIWMRFGPPAGTAALPARADGVAAETAAADCGASTAACGTSAGTAWRECVQPGGIAASDATTHAGHGLGITTLSFHGHPRGRAPPRAEDATR
jgi:hypothetical protein